MADNQNLYSENEWDFQSWNQVVELYFLCLKDPVDLRQNQA